MSILEPPDEEAGLQWAHEEIPSTAKKNMYEKIMKVKQRD